MSVFLYISVLHCSPLPELEKGWIYLGNDGLAETDLKP